VSEEDFSRLEELEKALREIAEKLERIEKSSKEVVEKFREVQEDEALEEAAQELERVIKGPVDRGRLREIAKEWGMGPEDVRGVVAFLEALGLERRPAVRSSRFEAWVRENPAKFGLLMVIVGGLVAWFLIGRFG